jgi:hypothetical protein
MNFCTLWHVDTPSPFLSFCINVSPLLLLFLIMYFIRLKATPEHSKLTSGQVPFLISKIYIKITQDN